MSAAPLDPMALLASLVVDDDGLTWGERATPWQLADAEAILLGVRPEDVRLHLVTRPKGGSKTGDLAAVLLVAMIVQAPRRATLHAYAADADQAMILADELRALAERSGLVPLLDFQASTVTVRATGARLRVESADAASAHGRKPWFIICDELGNWRETREARALWENATAGLAKVSTSRLAAITTASDPSHWAYRVLDAARTSPAWRVSEIGGPLPWVSAADLAVQRTILPPSRFAQLHLNEWTASEDRLVTADDLRACVAAGRPVRLDPDPRHRYQLGLDLGWTNDATVLTVAHAEMRDGARVIVLDRMDVMQGSRKRPVQLAEVQGLALDTSRRYGGAALRLDPREAVAMAQALRDRGMRVDDRQLTVKSVGQIGGNLRRLLSEHRIELPDDPDLLAELSAVRLRTTSLGELRLDHDAGQHDDRAMSLGLAALALTERDDADLGGFAYAKGSLRGRTRVPGAPSLLPAAYGTRIRGEGAAIAKVLREQTPAQRRAGLGLMVPGSVNDQFSR